MNGNTLIRKAFRVHLACVLAFGAASIAAAQDTPRGTRPRLNGQVALSTRDHAPASVSMPQSVQLSPRPAADQRETKSQRPAGKQPKRTLNLSNPRAAMRTFLVAAQAAIADHPERIDDAVACLDTSDLDGEDVVQRARLLARRLHGLIERKGVRLEDIPEQTSETVYVFHRIETEGDEPLAPQISLARDAATGHWLFSAQTLASIPAMEESIAKQAGPRKPVVSAVPVTRQSPRSTMATFLEAMNADPPNLDEAVKCLDPTGRDPEVWRVHGKDLAGKLKNVMDKIAEVVLAEIPDAPEDPPHVWYTGKTGNIVIGRIEADGKDEDEKGFALRKGEWRFTPTTLDNLDALFDEFEKKAIVRELQEAGITERLTFGQRLRRLTPQWLRRATVWDLERWQWVALVVLLPLGWLIQILCAAVAAMFMRSWLRRRKLQVDRQARRQVVRSLGAVVTVVFWYYAIQHLELSEGVLAVLLRVTKLALGVTCVWVGYRVVDILGGHIAADKEVQVTRFDDVLIPLLRRMLRAFVVLVVALLVLDWLGWKPLTVLGALGIGGFALAFAAQDTLNNFFGSITVLFDRPFGIGDWIVIGNVEGTVERVGFRSTRVRTFYNSVITIPNSMMVNTQVDNYGARRYRRVKVMLSVTYSTPPEKIDAFCEGIRELVRLHPYTRKDYYHIYFNKFAASSLDILVYMFFEVPDWGTELRERHHFFVDIMRLADRLGVEFAFPTQTLWLERTPDEADGAKRVSITPGRDDPADVGLREAAGVFEEAYGAVPVRRGPVVIDTHPRSKGKEQEHGDEQGEVS